MRNAFGKPFIGAAAAAILAAFSSLASAAPDGTIELELYKVGLVAGVSGLQVSLRK